VHLLELTQLKAFLANGKPSCHVIGVAGSGMSSLAKILLQQGYRVSGSDLKKSKAVHELCEMGMRFFEGHHADHLQGAEWVVYSSAIRVENPEWQEAERRGLPLAHRAMALASVVNCKNLLMVCGTHGKTTTTSMLAWALAEQKPSYYVGAEVPVLGSGSHWESGSEDFVFEADESDGSLSVFEPTGTIMLNVEAEHLDYFENLEAIKNLFNQVVEKTKSAVVFCNDDEHGKSICSSSPKAKSYGFSSDAVYRIDDMKLEKRTSSFSILKHGQAWVEVTLQVPGKHNVLNATAVLALLDVLGKDVERGVEQLRKFRGAKRRFDVLFESEEYCVVDDYAHHPTEIKATLEAARNSTGGRVVAVFQPHRYSRTQALMQDFAQCFESADLLMLTDIYPASELPIDGVDGQALAEVCGEHQSVVYRSDLLELRTAVSQNIKAGDLVLFMGAGDIDKVAYQIAGVLKAAEDLKKVLSAEAQVRVFEPMRKHTSMRVGGPADIWVEPATVEDLRAIVLYAKEHHLPRTIIGRGTNLLVKDNGIRGICVHFKHANFSRIEVTQGKIYAAAGARLRHIVTEAKRACLTGFEFMEGIPASMGGAMRMNAGAMGGWAFDIIESVEVMTAEGEVKTLPSSEVEVHYRNVPLFEQSIALGAWLKGTESSAEKITQTLDAFSKKRWESQPAAPSAGCIFKNPKEMPAGAIIDQLGLKGVACGGAKVSEEHGNFIVNDGNARAQDVLDLMGLIRSEVKRKCGIDLETEVMVIGE